MPFTPSTPGIMSNILRIIVDTQDWSEESVRPRAARSVEEFSLW